MKCIYDTTKTKYGSECYSCALSMTRKMRGGGICPFRKVVAENALLKDFICDNTSREHCEFWVDCKVDCGTDACVEYIIATLRARQGGKE